MHSCVPPADLVPLNASQRAAVLGLRSGLSIIHGPPGSGKSTTIFHVINTRVAPEAQVGLCWAVAAFLSGRIAACLSEKNTFALHACLHSALATLAAAPGGNPTGTAAKGQLGCHLGRRCWILPAASACWRHAGQARVDGRLPLQECCVPLQAAAADFPSTGTAGSISAQVPAGHLILLFPPACSAASQVLVTCTRNQAVDSLVGKLSLLGGGILVFGSPSRLGSKAKRYILAAHVEEHPDVVGGSGKGGAGLGGAL